MVPAFKSELKKLLTVRSTYFITAIALLLIGFFSFYVWGYKATGRDVTSSLFVAGTIEQIPNVVSVFGALIALLMLAHEYRYNTLVYTLTAANSRSKVLASKILAVFGFTLVFSVVLTAVGLGMLMAGAAVGGHSLPHQDISYLTYFGKSIFLCEGFAMVALLFVALIRNQVGSIAALFIIPNTIEGLLTLLLKKNGVYLPFTALQQVVQPPVIPGAKAVHPNPDAGYLSAPRGALIFLAYLVVGWIITWYLFLRRDAT